MLTPLDVQKRSFKKSVRGFNQEEVIEYMALVANTLEGHINENIMLKEKLDRRDEALQKYKQIEQTLSETLVVAKKSSEDMITNAKKEAENIVKEANLQAQAILDNADKAIISSRQKQEEMEKDLETFRLRMENMLKSQLDLVNKYNVDLK